MKKTGITSIVFLMMMAAFGCGVKRPPQPAYATPQPFKSDLSKITPSPTPTPSTRGTSQ